MIVQRSKPGASDPTDPEAGKSPDAQKAPGEADGDADRDPPPTDADVYRQIRKGAPPQLQQMLDRLMKAWACKTRCDRPRADFAAYHAYRFPQPQRPA